MQAEPVGYRGNCQNGDLGEWSHRLVMLPLRCSGEKPPKNSFPEEPAMFIRIPSATKRDRRPHTPVLIHSRQSTSPEPRLKGSSSILQDPEASMSATFISDRGENGCEAGPRVPRDDQGPGAGSSATPRRAGATGGNPREPDEFSRLIRGGAGRARIARGRPRFRQGLQLPLSRWRTSSRTEEPVIALAIPGPRVVKRR